LTTLALVSTTLLDLAFLAFRGTVLDVLIASGSHLVPYTDPLRVLRFGILGKTPRPVAFVAITPWKLSHDGNLSANAVWALNLIGGSFGVEMFT